MKKITIIVFYSVYLFFLLGFIFHTSAHPEILGKYTLKYTIYLGFFILIFPLIIYLINFIFKTTKIKYKKRKFVIAPKQKIIISVILLTIIFFGTELFLQKKYKGINPLEYVYSIENYHPFLQFHPISKNNNLNINSHNFRGDEISISKDENTFRIFIMGGSTVYNSGVKYPELFSKLLQDKLQYEYRDKKIEVINTGVDGYTTEHSTIQYLFKVKDFDPDLIILWQGINDLTASCNSPLSYGEYKNDYSHLFGASRNMVYERFFEKNPIKFNLLTLSLFKDTASKNLYSDLTDKFKLKNKYSGEYANENKHSFYDLKELPSEKAYERNIKSFIEITKNDRVPLILGNQASIYKSKMSREEKNVLYFGADLCRENGKLPSIISTKNSLERFNNITKKVAIEEEVSFIDLDKSIPKDLDHFTDDIHYTSLSNRLISEILFKKIIEGGYVN